ncbi:terminase small subunit [Aurantimonas coralicida]|uniref:terminase small subunit n=1 Tax=Aurantimonas coralicida TaxID=182270 RepID=UPI000410C987|nr:terminase small subunit [Aurantimonas coralicida]
MTRKFRPVGSSKRSTADAVEAAAERSEKSARVVSIAEFSRITGFDRGTLRGWIDKGCPTESAATARGEAILVDVRAVWKWREEQVARDERRKFEMPDGEHPADGAMGKLDIKDRKDLAAARTAEMKLAQTAKILIHREPLEFAYVEGLSKIRQSIMSIPDRIFRDMAGFDDDRCQQWRLDALKTCRAGLVECAKSMNDMFSALADDVGPAVIEADPDA